LIAATKYDPAELERSEERLFALRGAARKHHVTPDGLAALFAEVNAKLAQLESGEERQEKLAEEVATTRAVYMAKADALSERRVKAARKLEKAVVGELESLRMAATQFTVQMEALFEERWGAGGKDNVQFWPLPTRARLWLPCTRSLRAASSRASCWR